MSIAELAQQAMTKKGYQEKAINGSVYSIKLLPAFTGLAVGKQLSELALPVISMIVDQESNEGWTEDETPLTSIALVLTSQMDKVDILQLVQQLLNGSLKDGSSFDANEEFAGLYDELFELIAFSLQVNFGSFFTKFLKAKGLEIPSLEGLMTPKGQTSQG